MASGCRHISVDLHVCSRWIRKTKKNPTRHKNGAVQTARGSRSTALDPWHMAHGTADSLRKVQTVCTLQTVINWKDAGGGTFLHAAAKRVDTTYVQRTTHRRDDVCVHRAGHARGAPSLPTLHWYSFPCITQAILSYCGHERGHTLNVYVQCVQLHLFR